MFNTSVILLSVVYVVKRAVSCQKIITAYFANTEQKRVNIIIHSEMLPFLYVHVLSGSCVMNCDHKR